MPSKSRSQHNLMRMCASSGGRKAAGGACPPAKVAKEYVSADKKAGKFRSRGSRKR